MILKLFHFILVYIIAVFNVSILTSPVIAMMIPFLKREGLVFSISSSVFDVFVTFMFFLFFLVSVVMLLYFFLDFIFGFSMRSHLKGCKRFEKIKEYEYLKKIFEQTKMRFKEKNVQLYVKESDEVNAFAVASFGRRAIVLSSGIIREYLRKSDGPEDFLLSLRSVLGHEMSHLVNKDFLPTYMIIANQKATNLVASLVNFVFSIFARLVLFLPYGGRVFALVANEINSILGFIIRMFNKYIVDVIYEFLRKFISRGVEYRCDRQSAHAFGGNHMARSLSFLGKSGYFTIFATHPSTQSRIKKVKKLKLKHKIIRPSTLDSLTNYFAFLTLIAISLYFAKEAGVDRFLRYYIGQHDEIHSKLHFLFNLIKGMI